MCLIFHDLPFCIHHLYKSKIVNWIWSRLTYTNIAFQNSTFLPTTQFFRFFIFPIFLFSKRKLNKFIFEIFYFSFFFEFCFLQVSEPILAKTFHRKVQSKKIFTHRESFDTIIAKTEEKLAQVCKLDYFYIVLIATKNENWAGPKSNQYLFTMYLNI